jgi:carbonic anhydrase/acetyltransferase-like protein (isoleucine patch superfamily)
MLYALGSIAPTFDGDYFAAPTAAVIGKVHFGQDSSVWWGATLRGDNELISLGAGCNVQDNAVIHTDMGSPATLHAGVTVGHLAMLHGCTIGENSLIGIGAIILNGAVIGKNCIIGAGSLIAEGKQIPDGSLVLGSPGRVLRALAPEEIERLKQSSAHYIEKSRLYRTQLKAI